MCTTCAGIPDKLVSQVCDLSDNLTDQFDSLTGWFV